MFDVDERIRRGMDKFMEDHKRQVKRTEHQMRLGSVAGVTLVDSSLNLGGRGARLGNLQTKPRGLRRNGLLLASYFQPGEQEQFWAFRQLTGTRQGVDFAHTEGLELPQAWDSLQLRLGSLTVAESNEAESGLKRLMETSGVPLVTPTVVVTKEG